jgi:hypothetical protein
MARAKMATKFQPRLDILPPAQRRLWDELGATPAPFVLYGGTALALHFGHRRSDDFDFFADRNIDPGEVYRATPFLRDAQIIQQEPNTLTCLVDRGGPVRLSFFGLAHLARLCAPRVADDTGLKIAAPLDLAATKAAVVQQRAQAKDYVDIDALIMQGGIALATQLAAARSVYGDAFAPTPTLKALTYFADGDLPALPEDLKRRLAAAAVAVDPLRLPVLERAGDTPPGDEDNAP